MAEVVIRYCVPCRYQRKAMQDADAILKQFGGRLASLRLVPADRGVYDVAMDGDVLFSLETAMRFPETEELLEGIREKLRSPSAPG